MTSRDIWPSSVLRLLLAVAVSQICLVFDDNHLKGSCSGILQDVLLLAFVRCFSHG